MLTVRLNSKAGVLFWWFLFFLVITHIYLRIITHYFDSWFILVFFWSLGGLQGEVFQARTAQVDPQPMASKDRKH